MGKKAKDHKKRVRASNQALGNPVTRKAVSLVARRGVVAELSRGSVTDQIGRLDELVGVGTLPGGKLKEALMQKAPKEMDKAIKKFRKEGKPVNVDTLTAEIRTTPGFLTMCHRVGLELSWFEKLAEERMKALGVTP